MATEDMDAALARALQEEEFAAARAAPQQHAHGDLIAQLNSCMDKVIKVWRSCLLSPTFTKQLRFCTACHLRAQEAPRDGHPAGYPYPCPCPYHPWCPPTHTLHCVTHHQQL